MSEFEPKQQSASYAEKLQEKPEAGTGRKSMVVLAACAVLAVLSLVYLTINVATNSITLSVNKRAVEQLSESILNKQTALEDLQSSIDLKREKDREFDTAILRKKNEREGLEVELDRANKTLAAEEEARASLANVHDGLALSRKKWDDVKKVVRDLENKKILLDDLLPKLSEDVAKLDSQLKLSRKNLSNSDFNLEKSRQALDKQRQNISALKVEIGREHGNLNATKNQIDSERDQMEGLRAKQKALRVSIDTDRQKAAVATAEANEAVRKLNSKNNQIVLLEREMELLAAVKDRQSTDQANLTVVRQSLTEVKQELQKKSAELRTARDSLMQQRTERAELTAIIGSLKGQKGVLIQEISGLNSDRKQLGNVDADLNESRQMLNNRNRDIEAAELALGQAKSKEADSRNQYETLSAKIAELKSTRTSYEASVIAVENQLNELDKRKKDAITEITLQHSELLSSKSEMIRLKEDTASSQGSIEGLKKRAAQLREEIKALKDAEKEAAASVHTEQAE